MSKYGEDDVNVLHPSLRSIFTKPEKSLGLDKEKLTIDVLRDVFRKNCIALIPDFAQSGKAKLNSRQLILAYHLSRGTVKGTANEIKELMESSPYFDFEPHYLLPILRPVKTNMDYSKKFRGFRMLAVVYAPEEGFNINKIFDWSLSFSFHVEYVLRRHKITKSYEDFMKLNRELEQELLTLPAFPDAQNMDKTALGLELQYYIYRLHHALAERGVFSPRLLTFLQIDYERVQSEEEGAFVLALDTPTLIPNTVWHFIDEKWLENWRIYVRGRPPRRYYPPGPINNQYIYSQWKAYDDALKAAQRAEKEEQTQQEHEHAHKLSFAARVLKLTKDTALGRRVVGGDGGGGGGGGGGGRRNMLQPHRGHGAHLHALLDADSDDGKEKKGGDEHDEEEKDHDDAEEKDGGEASTTDDSASVSDDVSADDEDFGGDRDEDDNGEGFDEGDGHSHSHSHSHSREAKPSSTTLSGDLKPHSTATSDMFQRTSSNSAAIPPASPSSSPGKSALRLKQDQRRLRQQQREERRQQKQMRRLQKQKEEKSKAKYVELPAKLDVIVDYRVVNFNVWRFLQLVHGGGPVISRELPDLYAKQTYTFLHAVVMIQTRIRIKLARMQLQRLRLRKLSQTYAGKLLLVQEANQVIQARARRQLEDLRQARITKNLDTAATFTQHLWRLKKHYYNEEALEAKQKEQQSFAHVHRFQGDIALSNEQDGHQVVLDRKPVIQLGSTNVYAVVFADNDGALPFVLHRLVGTQQAMVAKSKDERRIVPESILLSINGKPTNTLSYEEIKQDLSHAAFPLRLEFMKPYETRLLPTLMTLVQMKVHHAGKFAIYAAFKMAMIRGIRLIKHHAIGHGLVCTSHRTVLKINDCELMYQSQQAQAMHEKYLLVGSTSLRASAAMNKKGTGGGGGAGGAGGAGTDEGMLPYDPEKEWVRFSLFDIKFIRDGRESEIIQQRRASPLWRMAGATIHPSRCFELVLEDHVLAFEFPSLKDEAQYLHNRLAMLQARISEIDAHMARLDRPAAAAVDSRRKPKAAAPTARTVTKPTTKRHSSTASGGSSNAATPPPNRRGTLQRTLTMQLHSLQEEVHHLQQLDSSHPSLDIDDDDGDEDDGEDDDDDDGGAATSDDDGGGGHHAAYLSSSGDEAAEATTTTASQRVAAGLSAVGRADRDDQLTALYLEKRSLLAELHMVERELLDLETLRTYLTALRVKPIAPTASQMSAEEPDPHFPPSRSPLDAAAAAAAAAASGAHPPAHQHPWLTTSHTTTMLQRQGPQLVSEDADESLHHFLWDTFVDLEDPIVPNGGTASSGGKKLSKKQQQQMLREKQVAALTGSTASAAASGRSTTNATASTSTGGGASSATSGAAAGAAGATSGTAGANADDDNADMDEHDRALCAKFQRDPSNDAFLYKRIVMTNFKRLVEEIRATQVFVSKSGVPTRRRQQKTALKRVGQDV
jgi:hypothetical protein